MLKTVLVGLLVIYLGVAVLLYLSADRLIFLPPTSSYTPGRFPIFHVPTEDGARIATLHLPNPASAYTLIYSHGNAEDLGHLVPILETIRDSAGVGVLAFDYRGYGLSTGGPPTVRGAVRDADAVYRHAVTELGLDPSRIILHGRSVGTGPAVEIASREPVAGLVIESGFVSAFRVVTGIRLFLLDPFPNLRHMKQVRAPVLVIHGKQDEVIPFAHGVRLYDAAQGRKERLWVEDAGHNDLVQTAGPDYWIALRDFVRKLNAATPS